MPNIFINHIHSKNHNNPAPLKTFFKKVKRAKQKAKKAR